MAKIRIIDVPPGEAPKEIRMQWVGVEIPLLTEQNTEGLVSGVPGGEPDHQNLGGYRVSPDEAIFALRKKDVMAAIVAADWWSDWRRNNPMGKMCEAFIFAKNVCELVK